MAAGEGGGRGRAKAVYRGLTWRGFGRTIGSIKMAKGNSSKTADGSALDFEAQLWAAADTMRGHMDASEYCLRKFASAEGKGGGEFYTPQCVVQVLVAMLEPYKGRVFETLQSANTNCRNRRMNGDFSRSASNGERAGVRCRNFGINRRGVQNIRRRRWPCASTTTWKLARMNLAIRGIDANLGPRNADSFRQDLHPDLKADFILANGMLDLLLQRPLLGLVELNAN